MAHAQSQTGPGERAAAPRTSWYGWQIILADTALLAAADATEGWAPLIGIPLSGPIVHGLHVRGRAALLSLTLRLGLSLAGGYLVGDECETLYGLDGGESHPSGCFAGAVTGLVVGYLVALAVDTAVLSRVRAAPPRAPPVTPLPRLDSSSASAGLMLRF